MSIYASYPMEGVPIYANLASFPPSAVIGALGVAADTGDLYEWNGSAWQLIAGPGAAGITLGNLDAQAATAKGAALVAGALSMQSADATHPGLVNNTTQTLSGAKTFSSAPNLSSLTASQALVLDSSKNVTTLAYSPGDVGNALVQRDSQGNSIQNNSISGVNVTVTSGQVINMTSGQARIQKTTGTSTATFNLPDATTLTMQGWTFEFNNNSTGSITINKNDGSTLVATAISGAYAYVICTDNSTTNGVWDVHWLVPTTVSWGTNVFTLSPGATFNLPGSSSGQISLTVQANSGTYNWNYPITAGSAGQVLTSQAGGSSAMTWTSASAFAVTSLTGDVTGAGPGATATTIANNAVSNAKFRQSSGLSVVGNSTSSTANVADIAGAANQTLFINSGGTSLGFGTLPIAAGGTGQTSASSAFNALSPMTTLGDLIYGGASGTGTRLAGNTTATLQALTQTGTGSVSAAPVWTSAVSTNTASTIVVRDGSGNFSAGTITAALTGTASGNTTYTANNHGVVLSSSTNAMTVLAPNASTAFPLVSGGTGSDPSWAGLTVAGGGTGQTTLTNHSVLLGAGASGITQLAVPASGTVLTGVASSDPAFSATPTLGVNGTTTGQLNMATSAGSGASITIQNRAGTTAYNFNLPNTAGAAGTALTSQGGGTSDMTWSSILTNPMTTGGDIIYGGSSGTPTRLANGSSGQFLKSTGGTTAPAWTTLTASTVTLLTANGSQTGWLFTISTTSTVAVGDTYTNNSNTYTVQTALSATSGQVLWMSGTGATSGTTLTRATGSGTSSITFSTKVATATYTSPAGVTLLKVTVLGGGGGGGGMATVAADYGAGGGGGAGGCAISWIGSPASSYAYIIGSAGAGGTAGANDGSPGTASGFSGTLMVANGGSGGRGGTAVSAALVSFYSGTSGQGSGGSAIVTGTNVVSFTGEGGIYGLSSGASQAISGSGGSSLLGSGAGYTTSAGTGIAATGYGSGGGGGLVNNGSSSAAGGAGTQGIVVVEEYY